MVNWEENGGGIDWSLTVIHAHMHKNNITHHLKLIMDWKEKSGEALVTSSHACTHKTQLTN